MKWKIALKYLSLLRSKIETLTVTLLLVKLHKWLEILNEGSLIP